MASAGTGDVLSGIIGAFLSQGIPDVLSACAGVYLHGLCGDEVAKKHGEIGLLATDILNELPVVINSFVEKSPTPRGTHAKHGSGLGNGGLHHKLG